MARPKIGIALGAGVARGFAHIGVLRVLEQAGIPIDYIAGSSMGSLVGVMYANRLDLDMCEQLAIQLKRKWMDLTVPKRGFVAGDKVKELVRLLTHNKRLEELAIPTAVVATDLNNGELVVFKTGAIDHAVRASVSVPGIFEPVFTNGRVLVDGGVLDRVPISVVREMGADIVIAVDVSAPKNKVQIETIFDVIAQTINLMQSEILSQQLLQADCLMHPDVADISPTAFTRIDECIRRGENEARKHLPALQELIQQWQKEG